MSQYISLSYRIDQRQKQIISEWNSEVYKLNLWAEESLEYVANSVEAEGLKLKETKAGVKVYFDIIPVPVHPIKAYFKAIPYSQKH